MMSCAMRGMLAANARKNKRRTLYRMIARKNMGTVPCFCCGMHVDWQDATLEHIRPRSRGGSDEMSNLSISHRYCNKRRGARWRE